MMTHANPNVTQVPRDENFRKLISCPSNKLFVDIDADQLELVMLGHYLGPYDNYAYAEIVEHGDKSKGTDIHTVNQKLVGLPNRDTAKRLIYATLYGAGNTKIGFMLYNGEDFEYTPQEEAYAKEYIQKRTVIINGKHLFPISKTTCIPINDKLIKATIYGRQKAALFKDGTKGYNELTKDLATQVEETKHLIALDGRRLYCNSAHKALNLALQSAGAIFMKYLLININSKLRVNHKYKDDFAFILNIHDAISLEINPEIKDSVAEILTNSFLETSQQLGFKYPVHGNPKFGKNQWETH